MRTRSPLRLPNLLTGITKTQKGAAETGEGVQHYSVHPRTKYGGKKKVWDTVDVTVLRGNGAVLGIDPGGARHARFSLGSLYSWGVGS